MGEPSEPSGLIPEGRGVLRVAGEDRVAFLQGIVSNDVTKVSERNAARGRRSRRPSRGAEISPRRKASEVAFCPRPSSLAFSRRVSVPPSNEPPSNNSFHQDDQ